MASEDEIAEVKGIIELFYQFANVPLPAGFQANERVAEVFGVMLSETRKCSQAFAWVPTPLGGRATVAWLVRQLGRGVFNSYKSRLSFTCARRVIDAWHRELERASLGLATRGLPAWA